MESAAGERPLPIGRGDVLEALPLTAGDDHAVLVREAGTPRVLLTAEVASSRERLVVMPLSTDELEMRVDGDALAVWLASAPIAPGPQERVSVPAWANVIGLLALLLIVASAIVGAVVILGWVAGLLGG